MVAVRTAVLTQADGAVFSLSSRPTAGDDLRWIVTDVEGWYGGSSSRATVTDRLTHGEFSTQAFRTNRTLMVHGSVICASTDLRDWAERQLSGIAWSGDWADLTCNDGNGELSARVRIDGEPQVVKSGLRGLDFQLPLYADSPFLQSAWRESTLQPIGAGVGFEFPPFTHYPDARVNVIPNHSFDDNLDGWQGYRADASLVPSGAGNVARITSTSDDGPSSLYESVGGTNSTPVEFGQYVTVGYDVLDGAARVVNCLAYFYQADGSHLVTVHSPDTQLVAGEIARPVEAFMVPAEAAYVRLMLARADRPSGEFADVDNVSVEVGDERTSGAYFGAISGEPILTFGTAVDTDELIWNDGNADSFPQFEVTADAPGGFAVSLGDRRVTYPWPTFPDMPVVVDMSGSLTVSGADQSHLLGERNWSGVAPRSVESPSMTFLQGGTGWATVRHRDTFI